ncbi:GNAT family N-acetyltransferase [Oscillochloris sp. ZM17-4]|uniref:GNAT family N-acetyltransferase n=1 Tax=Oscillochloris sp. ZM17-4 TaxID=2866714 RepID=UPI001C7396B1|nr:GNAT family N-acetyltransferase [Oscillochloris sp. ZM17-4]MBX0326996.1 GNAT family N-acetyltransferase [Oscillochloris sp. ZM17-4]
MDITYTSAAALSLEALADLFTRSFEGYYYPGVTTAEALAVRVRVEQIDLWSSPVLLADGEPAGITLIARRGDRTWCGGFGVVAAQRGLGLAHALTAEMVSRARSSGARRLTLEVLTRNERAIRAYQRAGLAITRRLLIMSWRPGDDWQPADLPLVEMPPEALLSQFAALHPAPVAWQRDLPALLVAGGRRGLSLPDPALAYALVSGDAESLRIADLGARDAEGAYALLRGLQARSRSLISVNEPAESPLTAAFHRAGFVVADEQHEMEIML